MGAIKIGHLAVLLVCVMLPLASIATSVAVLCIALRRKN